MLATLPLPKLLILLIVVVMLTVLPSIYISQLAEASESSKTLFFFYAISIVLTIAVICLPKAALPYFEIKKQDIFLLILILYMIINRFFYRDYPALSIPFYELIGLSFFYLVLRSIQIKYYTYFLLSSLCGSVIQVVHGLLQLLKILPSQHADLAITGNFFNSGPYAAYLTVSGVLALGMYLYKSDFIRLAAPKQSFPGKFANLIVHVFEYLPSISLIAILIMLPALRSRAAWLGFIGGALLLLYTKYHQQYSPKKLTAGKRALVISLLLIAICSGGFGLYQYKKDSANGRLLIYNVTTDIIKTNPLTGLGFDGFKIQYMNAQASWLKRNGEVGPIAALADNTYYAFNEPLQFIAENGILGLFLIVLVIYGYLYLKTSEECLMIKRLCLAVLFTAFIFGSVTYLVGNLPVKMVIVLSLALLTGITNNSTITIKSSSIPKIGQITIRGIVVGLGILLISFGFYKTIRLQRGLFSWYFAQKNYQSGRYDTSLVYFKNAFPFLNNSGEYLMQYGKALTMAGQYRTAVSILKLSKLYQNTTVTETALGDAYKALGNYTASEQAYLHASYMIPSRFYPDYLLVKLYEASNQHEKAKKKAMELMVKDIKIPSTAIKEMKEEIKMILTKYQKTN